MRGAADRRGGLFVQDLALQVGVRALHHQPPDDAIQLTRAQGGQQLLLSPSRSSIRRSGCEACRRSTVRGASRWATTGNTPTRTLPDAPLAAAVSSAWVASSSLSSSRARPIIIRPSGVGVTPWCERSNNVCPASSSASASSLLSAGWLRCMASAARCMFRLRPSSSSNTRWRMRRRERNCCKVGICDMVGPAPSGYRLIMKCNYPVIGRMAILGLVRGALPRPRPMAIRCGRSHRQ